MEITTEQIKELRDLTGVSIMQCKKALEEAGGDIEKAKIALAKISKQVAGKKAERTLKAGTVASYIHAGGSVGAMVELACETDFVAKNEDFQTLAREIAMQVAATAPQFLKREDITEEDMTKVKELFAEEAEGKPEDIKEKIIEGKLDAHFGEKILTEQAYIKDGDKKIQDLLDEAVQKFGERTEITRFERFSL
jgi:elongation factor Ts